MRNRNVYIIAGPNGSGKTTFATKFLQDYVKCSNFVNADLAITRIKDRVKEGGHNVASQDVRRRFKRSIDNFFKLYQPLIDSWMFFNNAGAVPVLIGKGRNGQISIVNEELFKRINGLER